MCGGGECVYSRYVWSSAAVGNTYVYRASLGNDLSVSIGRTGSQGVVLVYDNIEEVPFEATQATRATVGPGRRLVFFS